MDIKSYLPSAHFQKTIGMILLGIAVIALIGFGLDYLKNRKLAVVSEKYGNVDILVKDTVEQDSDADTIPDWEETLWGLDPFNPDTNGDGVNDAVEVNQKRQDSMIENGVLTENLNETDQFARELFLTAAGFSEVGEITELDAESIAQSALAQVGEVETQIFHTADTFKQTTKKDSRTVNDYSIKMTKVFTRFSPGDDLTVIALTKAMQSNNPVDLKPIDEYIMGYTYAADAFQTVVIPSGFLDSHVQITNAYRGLAESVKGMKAVFENPIGALRSMVLYDRYLTMFEDGMAKYTYALVPYTKE